jgi:hypothetical protein
VTLSRYGSRWSRVSNWWKLVALCVGANLLECALVLGFDHGTRPDLAPQASAVAPLGVFSDLRWISVYHDSWVSFAGEIAAMLLVRGALIGWSVMLAWPPGRARPGGGRLFARGVLATAFAAVLLAPCVTLLFGLAAIPVSWLFLSAVPAALLVALIVHPIAISGDWWRRSPSLRGLGWVALAFFVLTLSTALMAYSPAALWPVVAAASGLFNAWCWVGLVHAVVDRPVSRRVVPVVPVALCALVGGVAGGAFAGFAHAHRVQALRSHEQASATAPSGPPILVVSGYGSTWDGAPRHPIPGNFREVVFSYRGLDRSGRPLPYGSSDTVKAITRLDRMLLAQVRALHRSTHERVDVVAESEGALIAKTALLADRHAPVSALVLASPLVSPGRVSYPVTGGDGWGLASDAGMRLLGDAFQGVSPIELSPTSRFVSSLDRLAPALNKAVGCPLRGVSQFALLPLADATVTPAGVSLSYPSVVVAAFHGGLLESPPDETLVSRALTRGTLGGNGVLRFAEDAIESASAAWQVPDLVPSDFPQSSSGGSANLDCSEVAGAFREAITSSRS